jgi:hypothetical protein
MLDVVAGEIQVGEHVLRHEKHRGIITADVSRMADEALLFTGNHLDPVSDLDCVLGVSKHQ